MSRVLAILFTISLIFVSLPSEGGSSSKKTEQINVCVSTYSKCNSNKILKIDMITPKYYMRNMIDDGKYNDNYDFYLIGMDRNRDKLSNAERISERKATNGRNTKTDKGSRSISYRCIECTGFHAGSYHRDYCPTCGKKLGIIPDEGPGSPGGAFSGGDDLVGRKGVSLTKPAIQRYGRDKN